MLSAADMADLRRGAAQILGRCRTLHGRRHAGALRCRDGRDDQLIAEAQSGRALGLPIEDAVDDDDDQYHTDEWHDRKNVAADISQ